MRPRRGGLSDTRRITYQAAAGEHVVIKGSERVTGWASDGGTVWTASVPNAVFGDFNPYAEEVAGDWIVYADGAPHRHLGDVYLNGLSFYEVASRDEVTDPPLRTEAVDGWTGVAMPVPNPEQTRLVWFAEVGADTTTIWANFQGADPNTELVEINVRRSVFFPEANHLDWITVRGFELAQAACPWTPPTADQPGLIGPNWAKGWIIEDNVIHDAKCSAISIGKEASTGHNYATERGDKPGYQYQLESVFTARQIGWDAEHIGSHIIRRNTIFDCGQNGIVGHLGCVFSTIEDNHIYRIATKREFYGYEIGGIKLHAAIDVEIRHNHIHDCTLGTWLDWQTQGTRISRNLFHRNSRDLFVEVSHGPYLVEHNVLASPAAIEIFSQGGAFVHNLIAGTVWVVPVPDRATPYHRPHSTQVAGYAVIFAGDDRWVANVFVGGDVAAAYGKAPQEGQGLAFAGTAGYEGYPASYPEYRARVDAVQGDHQRFLNVKQPVYARGNVYAAGAEPFTGESGPLVVTGGSASVVTEGDEVYLVTDLPAEFGAVRSGVVTGRDLERVRFADADFEERDGTPAIIDVDLVGTRKDHDGESAAGPIAGLTSGAARTRIW
ncbi:right-handed parallel beta-helix repeat-containing protein [Paractinoplanes durhamensis]|uniref:right-handed parallel beta-helix repeat-containing protein n=1 Tax=Paractinoplanes durhamensis TaxID=113563 RepID=UPI003635B416